MSIYNFSEQSFLSAHRDIVQGNRNETSEENIPTTIRNIQARCQSANAKSHFC